MEFDRIRHRLKSPVLLAIIASSIVLTGAFIGVVALIRGEVVGTWDRLPVYVLVFAVVFLVVLWKLDDSEREGTTVLIATAGIALAAGIVLGLAGEGTVAAVTDPWSVIGSDLLVYFVAAAVICTGLGLWGIRHWREFTYAYRVE